LQDRYPYIVHQSVRFLKAETALLRLQKHGFHRVPAVPLSTPLPAFCGFKLRSNPRQFRALVLFRAARGTAAKIVYTAHGFHFYRGAPLLNWLLFYPVEKRLMKYTDCLITINEEDYDTAKKRFKVVPAV